MNGFVRFFETHPETEPLWENHIAQCEGSNCHAQGVSSSGDRLRQRHLRPTHDSWSPLTPYGPMRAGTKSSTGKYVCYCIILLSNDLL